MMNRKYQIFISSIYTDLISAREKVRDAILSMLHFPVGMEIFGAADEEQWEIIQETIDSSDYYVLILAQRYGSVIEKGKDAGISYTEKEFRYAKEKGIPILAFILDDSVPVKKDYIETDVDKIQKLESFKAAVKQDRLVEWWKTTDELAQKVTAALHKQMVRKKRPGWVRGDSFDIEASHAELLELNKRIRELERENTYLKSKIVERKPKLNVCFLLDQSMSGDKSDEDEYVDNETECCSHGDLLLKNDDFGMQIKFIPLSVENCKNKFKPLTQADVFPELKRFVSDQAIDNYNKALPNTMQIDTYIEELERYQRIHKGGLAFVIHVRNDGTAKATDVRVSLEFPEEFLVFEVPDVENIKEPRMPAMPKNPIREAERKYERQIYPMADYVHQMAEVMPTIHAVESFGVSIPIGTDKEYMDIDDNTVEIKSGQIPHHDLRWFRGMYIVPTEKGKYRIKCIIMCSEYIEPEERYIDVEVV